MRANAQFMLIDCSEKKLGLRQKKEMSLEGWVHVGRYSKSDGSCQKIKT